jgi:hypothetical protein
MPLSSDLAEFPLNAIMHLLRHRSGILKFFAVLDNGWIELHLRRGRLTGIVTDTEVVHQPVKVRGVLLHLHALKRGRFEFHDLSEVNLQDALNINLMLFFLKTVTHEDDLKIYRDQIPDSETQFTFNDSNPLLFEAIESLDSETRDLWRVILPRLLQYPSVQQLATQTGLALPWVQLGLLRLQTAGIVRPFLAEENERSDPNSG